MVLTALTGRGGASAQRTGEAGMLAVDGRKLAEADFLLSIVPPGEALGLAKRWPRSLRPPRPSRFMST